MHMEPVTKKFGQKKLDFFYISGGNLSHSWSYGNNIGNAPKNIHCLIFCTTSTFMNTDELHASVCIREREEGMDRWRIKSLSSGTRVTLVIYATFADLG